MKKGQPLIVAGIYQIFHTVIQSWCNPQFSNLINSNHNGNKRERNMFALGLFNCYKQFTKNVHKPASLLFTYSNHVNISKKKKKEK